jgi:large subunit ribosomal protein L6
MSRVGRSPIPVPTGVEVRVENRRVTVTGPRGSLGHDLPPDIELQQDDGVLLVTRADDEREHRALHGLTRTLLNNMVVGVTVGVGYRAAPQGTNRLELALGFSHPVVVDAPEGISFEVPQPTRISVRGIDKQAVGQVAANIRSIRKPEPYKGKGVRYAGEVVRRKAGKAAK